MTKKIIKMRKRLNLQKGYEEGEVKVKEHDHIAKKYQGSAGQDCNLNLSLNKNITVVFHNFQIYDSHLTFQEIAKYNFKINVIPKTNERNYSTT